VTYVRNAWYVAAWASDIGKGSVLGVQILNERLVVWRSITGELTTLTDRCIHRLAPLSLGRCEGEKLRCMYHGFLYDRTGRVVEIPGQDRIPDGLRVSVYPSTERHGWVWVWMGDPAAAHTHLVPPVPGMDRSGYVFGRGQLDYNAGARLINDNLLDLSHTSFLHAKSFRMSETWAREHPKVTSRERGVVSERWFRNEGALGVIGSEPKVDTYFCFEFFVHGVLTQSFKTYALGTADALNGERPDDDPTQEYFTTQAVTPLTDKTARYFYMFATRQRRDDQTEYDSAEWATIETGFSEDKVMIEAQQRNIDLAPDARCVATAGDKCAILFTRLVKTLVRQESTDPTPEGT
jgi:phenylpropionate dioxygenase-like ring-hydroxylating dioxygenase large terminal subunit